MKKILFFVALGLTTLVTAQETREGMKAKLANLTEKAKGEREVVHAECNWEKYFKTCINKAQKEKKPIFILFTGSDWCGPCKKLEKNVLDTQKFKNYADKYFILYKADCPINEDLVPSENRKYNENLTKRFLLKDKKIDKNKRKTKWSKFEGMSFPTIVVMDDNGKVYGKREGIYAWDSYYDFFDDVVMNVKAKKYLK